MFNDISSPIGDDLLYSMVYLGKYLKEAGHKAATIDMEPLEKFDKIVFLDYPTKFNSYFRKLIQKRHPELYLIIFECGMLRPANFNKKNHKYFKKVFTWKTDMVDNKKYFHLMSFSNKLAVDSSSFDLSLKSKFCSVIAGHKYWNHPLELYSERVKAIRWFEKNHPGEFDLFGLDWDKFYFPGLLFPLNFGLKFLYQKMPFFPKLKLFPSYKGPVKTKKEVLKQYKFSICYENAVIPGYITEKIFDCFFSGCIPVYLGAPDVQDYIPSGCFIDKRNFKSYDELYDYLKKMSTSEHQNYLNTIHDFVTGPKIFPFIAEGFTQNLCGELLK
jgi:hypothetical protein